MYPAVGDQNTEVRLELIFGCDLPSFLGHWFKGVMSGLAAATLYP